MGYEGDKKRRYQNEWIKQRRADWIQSRGGACAKCGSRDNLEVDHIDPTSKMYQPREIWSRRKEVREAELRKCQVLCGQCHKEKTRAQLIGDHGSPSRSRKCSCGICREVGRKRIAATREARKKKCKDCDAMIHEVSIRCKSCSGIARRSKTY